VLPLDALRPPQPTWWSDVAREFPLAADDLDRWHREVDTGYDVLARYDSSAETARISLSSHSTEWPIRIVAAPVLHLFWLDQPPIDTGQRHALSRAFDEASLAETPGAEIGEFVRLTVRDSGPGLSDEALDQVFDAELTRRPAMAQAAETMRQLGGFIRVESAEGVGTAVHLYLPRAKAEPAVTDEAAAAAAAE